MNQCQAFMPTFDIFVLPQCFIKFGDVSDFREIPGCFSLVVARAAQHFAGERAGHLPVVDHGNSVYQHVFHPLR